MHPTHMSRPGGLWLDNFLTGPEFMYLEGVYLEWNATIAGKNKKHDPASPLKPHTHIHNKHTHEMRMGTVDDAGSGSVSSPEVVA